MKYFIDIISKTIKANQVPNTFTNKPINSCGDLTTIAARLLEVLGFRYLGDIWFLI